MRIFMLTATTFMDLDKMVTMPAILTMTREEGKGKDKKTVPEAWVLQVPQEGADPVYVRSNAPVDETPTDLQEIIDRIVRSTWNGVEEAIVRFVPLPKPEAPLDAGTALGRPAATVHPTSPLKN